MAFLVTIIPVQPGSAGVYGGRTSAGSQERLTDGEARISVVSVQVPQGLVRAYRTFSPAPAGGLFCRGG
jgi:hypothetical protein